MEKLTLGVVKEKLTTIFRQYEELNTLLSSQERRSTEYLQCKKYFESKKFLLKQLQENKYYIAFIGPYSAGKSTLINAMLQRPLLPENLEQATTAFPTFIYPVSAESIEKANIVYCSYSEREAIKKFYLKILSDDFEKIKDEFEEYNSMNVADLLERLQELVDENTEYDKRSFETLCNLLNKWDIKVGETDPVEIDTIIDYKESNDNAVIINRADIYVNVNLFSGRKDIVLVDLPGVDAEPRHFETTKRFTIKEAKSNAYIFVTQGDKIANKIPNDFLLELAKHTQQISKAFWVLNKCDTYKDKNDIEIGIKELIENNKKKIRHINEQRVFAVSAQMYKENKENTDILVTNVDDLRTTFMDYLQNEFEYELAETNQKEYDQLKQKMLIFLETKAGHLNAILPEDREQVIELELIQNRINDWLFNTQYDLEKATEEIGYKIANLDFFNENLITAIKIKIDEAVEKVGKIDYTPINLPKDIEKRSPESKILDFQNNVLLNQFIRKAFASALENEGSLADIIENFNKISNHESAIFKDKKAIHSEITQRFEGICDIALIGYENVFNECVPLVINEEVNKKGRCPIVLKIEDYNEVISIDIEKINVTKPIINFVLDKSVSYESFIKIADSLGIKEANSEFDPNDNQYNDYIQTLVKHKMYQYIENLKIKLNQYVSVCLTNYFKDLFTETRKVVLSNKLELKLRLQFTKDLNTDRDVIKTENEKKSKIATLYTNLRNE